MDKELGPYDAKTTYVHLGPQGTAVPLPVTAEFWQQLQCGGFAHLGAGRLVSTYEFRADWAGWEKHPAAEEFVVLLGGAIEFVLDDVGIERRVALTTPGQFLLVPRDTWHTANVAECALALFITEGVGTQLRSRD